MKNRGFTIIEVLVVMGILGTLLLIAGLSGRAWLDRYRVEGQMNEMYVDLMNARASAMQKNRVYFVTFAATQYAVYEDTTPSPDGDGLLQPASDVQIMQKKLNADYAITSDSGEIDFDQRGLATGLTGTGGQTTIHVNASFGTANDCITVSPTRIRIGVYNGAACVTQ